MPKNKQPKSNPVSLFAFQDIITSVTGIMILIVLLLILSILDKKLTDTSVASEESIDSIETAMNTLQALKMELASEEISLERLDSLIVDSKKDSVEMLLKTKTTNEQMQELKINRLKALEDQNDIINDNLEKLSHNFKEKNDKYLASDPISKQEIDKLRKKLAEASQKLEALKSQQKQIKFAVPRNEKKNPILVQCSKDAIELSIFKTEKSKTITDKSNNFAGMISEFEEWLKTRNPDHDYIVMLLKPSSFGFAQDIMGITSSLGFEYGLEPLEEDRQGLF